MACTSITSTPETCGHTRRSVRRDDYPARITVNGGAHLVSPRGPGVVGPQVDLLAVGIERPRWEQRPAGFRVILSGHQSHLRQSCTRHTHAHTHG